MAVPFTSNYAAIGLSGNLYDPPPMYTLEEPSSWMKSVDEKEENKKLDEEIIDEFVEEGPPDQMNMYSATNAAALAEKRLAQGILVGDRIRPLEKKRVKRSSYSKKLPVKRIGKSRAVGSKKKKRKTTKRKTVRKSTKKRKNNKRSEKNDDDDDDSVEIFNNDKKYLF